jgi:hypothetical protein
LACIVPSAAFQADEQEFERDDLRLPEFSALALEQDRRLVWDALSHQPLFRLAGKLTNGDRAGPRLLLAEAPAGPSVPSVCIVASAAFQAQVQDDEGGPMPTSRILLREA